MRTSLRHACGVSCRVRAGRLPGRLSATSPRGPHTGRAAAVRVADRSWVPRPCPRCLSVGLVLGRAAATGQGSAWSVRHDRRASARRLTLFSCFHRPLPGGRQSRSVIDIRPTVQLIRLARKCHNPVLLRRYRQPRVTGETEHKKMHLEADQCKVQPPSLDCQISPTVGFRGPTGESRISCSGRAGQAVRHRRRSP